jgi:hypothetical protein
MHDLNLAVVGNCTLSALINRRSQYVWCCYPRLDGDPIFCSLLHDGNDADAGVFAVEVENLTTTHQYYLRNSAILVSNTMRVQPDRLY